MPVSNGRHENMSGPPGHINANASASAQELAANGTAPAPLFPAAAARQRKRDGGPALSPVPLAIPHFRGGGSGSGSGRGSCGPRAGPRSAPRRAGSRGVPRRRRQQGALDLRGHREEEGLKLKTGRGLGKSGITCVGKQKRTTPNVTLAGELGPGDFIAGIRRSGQPAQHSPDGYENVRLFIHHGILIRFMPSTAGREIAESYPLRTSSPPDKAMLRRDLRRIDPGYGALQGYLGNGPHRPGGSLLPAANMTLFASSRSK
ncbi:hypothetical protein DL766_010358 [Monosporascus sp. MC13-8B]|uniref:Uncharacterized protein n=1 Tax=Monosporascus cannonballus TaxID=155416 RepID=A0ABY0HI51_9PEZI|nr:hypothetical protein DL763_004722 [Monosporascus cannonballus]RYO94000.1 hypothetical protein DL762_000748 [Monosporascus cannonballus]RYP02460.1 hypothetical protein DL766_010358 [Monosporascus sp. MC13-8B]